MAQWRDEIRRIEDLGFSSVSVSDHVTGGWAIDPLVAMTVAAEATTRLRVLGMVFCNDFRHPVLLHRSLANLDVFSAGRVEFGLGAGWLRADHDAAGLPFDPPGVRVDRLAEAVEIILGLFADRPVTFAGRHYQVTELTGLPRPAQRPRPPLLIGGGSRRILELAGRRADIIGINPRLSPDVDPLAAVDRAQPAAAGPESRLGRGPPRWPPVAIRATWSFSCGCSTYGSIIAASSTGPPPVTPPGLTRRPLASSPAVLHGSVDGCVDQLVATREQFGISYLHLGGNLRAAAPIVARLAGR